MKTTREKIKEVASFHEIKDTGLAHLDDQFMDDMLSLIEREKREFKKQMKAEIKYMLNGFKGDR